MTLTPSIRKLIAHKISVDAIPRDGGFISAIQFLSDPKKVIETTKAASRWVEQAIAAVRSAPDNPYKTDEEIAAAILKGIEAKKRERAN